MVLGFALLLLGGLYLVSGWRGQSLGATLRGVPGSGSFLDGISATLPTVTLAPRANSDTPDTQAAALFSGGGGSAPKGNVLAAVRWAEKVAAKHGVGVYSAHRPGDRGYHSRRDKGMAASDLSNGTNPTPEMDAAVEEIAAGFGKRVSGKSPVELTGFHYGGMEIEILYRTQIGGNHNNHIHVGGELL